MISIVVEGESDREAARSIVRACGHEVDKVIIAGGKTRLDPLIPKYNNASAWSPWVMFRDSDNECPVELRDRLGAQIPKWEPTFLLRIAHTMTEAWLMADIAAFARYFSVSEKRVPPEPETSPHAKQTLLNLCMHSRSRTIREEVSPKPGRTGPLYVFHLNKYAETSWRPDIAAQHSPSLARTLTRISGLPTH